jgi:small nuclear ribonucleoprotein (snRNP)-like protein
MNYKQAMKTALDQTLNSHEFHILTVMNIDLTFHPEHIVITQTGRVFKGNCIKIYENFTNAVLTDVQGHYIYLKAEGQIDNEPSGGSLRKFQKQFLTETFNFENQIEQILGNYLFRDTFVFTIKPQCKT